MSRPFLSFAVFLLVSVSVLGGMHAYLWLRLVRDPSLPEPWRRIATVLLVLLAVGVPLGIFMARLGTGWVARIAPIAAATWLGIAFILFSTVLAFDLVRLAGDGLAFMLDWMRTRPDPPADPERRLLLARAIAGGAALAAGGATAFSIRSALGPAHIHEVPIELERLPPALSGLTIAQISDLHVGPTIRDREVRRVVEQTNALRPDLIAVTGDLVDGSVAELGQAVAELARPPGPLRCRVRHRQPRVLLRRAPLAGGAAAAGHTRAPERAGARSGTRARRSISPASTTGAPPAPLPGATRPRWAARWRAAIPTAAWCSCSTSRAGWRRRSAPGVELQLSGHTHGGQIFPFNFLVAAAYPYIAGLYRHREGADAGQVFVSRGTGFWGPPMRLGSPPEIAKIVLTR